MNHYFRQIYSGSIRDIYQGFRSRQRKSRAKRLIETYFEQNQVKKLHIGAGGSLLNGWLNVDIDPLEKGIAYLDASIKFPLEENSFDYVFSEHVFEHLTLKGQMNMLSETLRILKPGGKIRIATPNLDAILDIRNQNNTFNTEYINWSAESYFPEYIELLGNDARNEIFVINNYFYNWGHQFLHNPKTLRVLFEKSGFLKISRVEVYKSEDDVLNNLEMHGTVIPIEYNAMETMVFEAEK